MHSSYFFFGASFQAFFIAFVLNNDLIVVNSKTQLAAGVVLLLFGIVYLYLGWRKS